MHSIAVALASLILMPNLYYADFGIGCAGALGVPPTISARPGESPIVGRSFTAQVQPLFRGQPALMVLGFSRTSWWFLQLPAELSSFSMPGCYAYTDAFEAFGMTRVGN